MALLVTPARLVITKTDHGPSNECEMVTSLPEADQDDHSLSFISMNCSMNHRADTADTAISDAKVMTESLDYHFLKSSPGFKCCHINIHSLLRKIDELRHLILDLDVHCISVNETLLDSSISNIEINIDNFSVFRNDRNRHGGGVALYVHNDYKPSPVNFDSQTECIWVNVRYKNRKFVLGSLYRPPSSTADYHDSLFNDIEHISSTSIDLVLMGDLNYDISNSYDMVKVSEIETLFQLNQHIRQPTRVTNHSSTTIDHIYISKHIKPTLSGVLPVTLSDHYIIFSVIPLNKPPRAPKTSRRRNYKNFIHNNF